MDEIKQYITGRYIGPCEAVSSILGFPIHEREPPVARLQVHMPMENRVCIRPNVDLAPDTDNHARLGRSTLTAFFELCDRDEFARTLTYCHVSNYFRFENKQWQKRKRGKPVDQWPGYFQTTSIGRVYTVSPRNGDLYYLRILLHHVKGPRSFEYLRTHDDIVLPTFKDACRARGLLQDDAQWYKTLEDAEKTRLPKAMRDLFVCLLLHTDVDDVANLWMRFKDSMSEDFLHQERNGGDASSPHCHERHYDMVLNYIESKLEVHGKTLDDFNLPRPANAVTQVTGNSDVNHELNYMEDEQISFVNDNERLLNPEQKLMYQHICNVVDRESLRV